MAWGRSGGQDDFDDLDNYASFRKAQRISSYANDDSDAITSASRRQDQRLLNNITNRLQDLEMDSVKPGMEVSLQTGFRRLMYNKTRPPLEPETRARLRRRRGNGGCYDDVPLTNYYTVAKEATKTRGGSAVDCSYTPSYDTEVKANDWASLRAEGQGDPYMQLRVLQAKEKGWIPHSTEVGGYTSAFKTPSYVPRYSGVSDDYKTSSYSSLGLPSHYSSYDDVARPSSGYVSSSYTPAYVTSSYTPYTSYTPYVCSSETYYGGDYDVPSSSVSDVYYGRYVPSSDDAYYEDDYDGGYYVPNSSFSRKIAASKGDDEDVEDYEAMLGDKFRWARSRRSVSAPPPRSAHTLQNELGVSGSIRGFADEEYIQPRNVIRSGFSRGSVPPMGLRAHHPVLATRTTVSSVPGGGLRRRYGSLPPPSPSAGRRSRISDIEDRLDIMSTPDPGPPQTSYSQLRQRASQARDKMDRHKVLLDRYLPIYLGPENEVEYEVDYKFGELADRMPQLDPYRPPMPYHSPLEGEGYKAAKRSGGVYGKPPSGYSSHAPMSDTRKRIREVICSTRNDPTYYH